MQWTVQGEVKTTELPRFSRPAMAGTLAQVGLMLAEAKALLAKLQAGMLCGQVAEHADHHLVCLACGMLQPLKDRRTRRLQTLFGTVEVEAPRIRVCRCRVPALNAEVVFSPVCALLTARCTPELERVSLSVLAPCTAVYPCRICSFRPGSKRRSSQRTARLAGMLIAR